MNITEIFVNKLKIETKVVSIDSLFCDDTKVKKLSLLLHISVIMYGMVKKQHIS